MLTRPMAVGGRAAHALWRVRAELAVSAALLGGWAACTAGVAALTAPAAWPISAGLLLLSLCGWRFLGRIARDGLYVLTREDRPRA
jgi:hypothetical protein